MVSKLEEAKQILLRKQAQEIVWQRTLVLSQEHGTNLQQWNKSQRKDEGVKCCLHCQRIAIPSLSPSERLLQNWTRLSQILKEIPVFSVLKTILHESVGNSMGHSLSWVSCYECIPASSYTPTDLCCHFLPALCLESVSHRTACSVHIAIKECINDLSLCLISTSLGVGKLAPSFWQHSSARQKG